MKRILLTLALAATFAAPIARPAPTDDEVEAHRRVLDLAGAWTAAKFKLRDGNWSGPIKPGQAKLIQVNLYAGNDYWFSVAATDAARKLQVTVFDEAGAPVPKEADDLYEDAENHRAALAFSPTASGPYYVKIEELEGEPATFCLIYSYK
jgi:hypothetical protein